MNFVKQYYMKRVKYLVCFLTVAVIMTAAVARETIVNNAAKKATETTEPSDLHLGRYELYSGIPAMYLGHFILLPNGRYKVAFDTDANNYDESGRYSYNKTTDTIEWISGMFKNNSWAGKITKNEKGYHIQFNKATYGDSK
jgi:hypothetical protein